MSNHAAVLVERGKPLEVQVIEKHHPRAGEILIKTFVVASNPIDIKMQAIGAFVQGYPITIGSDVSGIVEEIGEGVVGFHKGDRVYTLTPSVVSQGLRPGGFQEYVISPAYTAAKLPERLSFEEGATLGLPAASAASGLFFDLKLPKPDTLHAKPLAPDAPVFFVSSGASAVGSAVVQLARLLGYRVIATSSPKNFHFVKSLGASDVFDYNDHEVAHKVKEAAGKPIHVGYDAASLPDSVKLSLDVLTVPAKLVLVLRPETKKQGVEFLPTFAGIFHQKDNFELSRWWFPFLHDLVEAGSFVGVPPVVVGSGGVADAQKLLDFHSKGVSAVKPVIKFA